MTATTATATPATATPATATPAAAPAAAPAVVPGPRGSRMSVAGADRRHVAKPSGKPDPTAHLSAADVEALGRELDALRQEVLDSRGARDAAYIRRVITVQRTLEMGSRAVLLFSMLPPAWLAGTAGLAVAKILENMEIGHNILHGQWDWMRDPKIHSSVWEWDHASPAELWKRNHNEFHHTYTNVLDRDNDLGYGIMRVDEDQPWQPGHLAQPVLNFFNACLFEYGIAAYDLDIGRRLEEGTTDDPEFRRELGMTMRKVRRQLMKDFVLHPLLSGPSALHTLAANAAANLVRNLWSHSVIMCGHFPEGVETFATDSIEGETRGEWYLRQMLGSANIAGPRAVHVMSGNLSHQIEHHLFPDLPSNRYAEIAPRVREICERYGLTYTTGSLPRQVASAWSKVIRLSLPNRGERRAALSGMVEGAAGSVRRAAGRAWARRPTSPATAGPVAAVA